MHRRHTSRFCRKNFGASQCRKKIIGDYFGVHENFYFNMETVYKEEGDITILRGSSFVSRSRKSFQRDPSVFRKKFGIENFHALERGIAVLSKLFLVPHTAEKKRRGTLRC